MAQKQQPFGVWSVDKRFLIPCVGKYNVMVYECPHCGEDLCKVLFNHIIGLSWTSIGLVFVVECPKCFEKFYFHCDTEGLYHSFLYAIEDGTNIHFKGFKL